MQLQSGSAPMTRIRIGYLCDVPTAIPMLARSLLRESPGYFPGRRPEDVIDISLAPTLQRDALPLALVAFADRDIAGIVVLRTDSIATHPHLGPWVAALHVLREMRHRGVGTALVRAAERAAERLGVPHLFAGMGGAASLFTRLGWTPIERLRYRGEPLVVLKRDLAAARDCPAQAGVGPILVFMVVAPISDADRTALHRGLAALQHDDGPLSVEKDALTDAVTIGGVDDDHLERVVDALARTYGVRAGVSKPHVGERECPVEGPDGLSWVPVEPWMDVLVRTPSRFVDAVLGVLPQHLPAIVTHHTTRGESTLAGTFPLASIRGMRSAVAGLTLGHGTVAMHFRMFLPVRRRDSGDDLFVPAPCAPSPPTPRLRARAPLDQAG